MAEPLTRFESPIKHLLVQNFNGIRIYMAYPTLKGITKEVAIYVGSGDVVSGGVGALFGGVGAVPGAIFGARIGF